MSATIGEHVFSIKSIPNAPPKPPAAMRASAHSQQPQRAFWDARDFLARPHGRLRPESRTRMAIPATLRRMGAFTIRVGRTLRLWGVLLLWAGAASTVRAEAQQWVVAGVKAGGVDALSVETFRELLSAEIERQRAVSASQVSGGACAEAGCVPEVAQRAGADIVVVGQVGRLGETLLVTVHAHDRSGKRVRSQRLTVNRLEDLEAAATRLAKALVSGGDAKDGMTLGTVTTKEKPAPLRRDFSHDFTLRVAAVVPFGDGLGGAPGLGLGVDVGYWGEAEHFAIDVRLGVRLDLVPGDDGYGYLPLDVGVMWLPLLGNFTPLIGAGMGPRFHWESRARNPTLGTVIPTRTEEVDRAVGFGIGGYARLGAMFLRTYSTRITLYVDYEPGYANLNGRDFQQAVSANLGVIF